MAPHSIIVKTRIPNEIRIPLQYETVSLPNILRYQQKDNTPECYLLSVHMRGWGVVCSWQTQVSNPGLLSPALILLSLAASPFSQTLLKCPSHMDKPAHWRAECLPGSSRTDSEKSDPPLLWQLLLRGRSPGTPWLRVSAAGPPAQWGGWNESPGAVSVASCLVGCSATVPWFLHWNEAPKPINQITENPGETCTVWWSLKDTNRHAYLGHFLRLLWGICLYFRGNMQQRKRKES